MSYNNNNNNNSTIPDFDHFVMGLGPDSSYNQSQQQQSQQPSFSMSTPAPSQQPEPHRSSSASLTTDSKRKFGFLQKYRVELPEAIKSVANSRGLIPLSADYKPTPYDIVCGRGRGNYNCEGNILFRGIVAQYVDQYLQSESKAAKTLVLVQVLEQVKYESRGKCRFVKQRPEDGIWCELGEVAAREKAGHAMRESIATRKKLNTSKRRAMDAMPLSSQKTLNQMAAPPNRKLTSDTASLVPSHGSTSGTATLSSSSNNNNKRSTVSTDDAEAAMIRLSLQEGNVDAKEALQKEIQQEDTTVLADQVFGKPVAALPLGLREGDSVLSAVGSSDFLACRSSEFLKKYGS